MIINRHGRGLLINGPFYTLATIKILHIHLHANPSQIKEKIEKEKITKA
jgi:hypothetical protein